MKKYITFVIVLLIGQLFAQTALEELVQKGRDLFDQKKYNEAIEIFEQVIDQNEAHPEANYYLGCSFFRLGDLDEATEYCEKAVELEDSNPDYHFRLGEIYGMDARDASIFRMPGLASGMKEHFQKAIELNPDHIEARIGLGQFYLMAPGIVGGDADKALEQANIIVEKDEKQGRRLLAQIYIELEKLTAAENEMKIYEEKFGDDPENFFFYNIYGYFLLEQNRVDEAIEKLKKQVLLAPNNANAHDSLGEALNIKGLFKESLEEYKKALELNPDLESAMNMIEELEEKL